MGPEAWPSMLLQQTWEEKEVGRNSEALEV